MLMDRLSLCRWMKSCNFRQECEGLFEQRSARFKYGCENRFIDLWKTVHEHGIFTKYGNFYWTLPDKLMISTDYRKYNIKGTSIKNTG